MNKEAKHTLVFIGLLIIVFFASDKVFGYLFHRAMLGMPFRSNQIARVNHVVNFSNNECYILGSSRASRHYVSNIFQEELGLTTYNAGKEGHGIGYANGVLNAVLSRTTPKLIILECSNRELNEDYAIKLGPLKPYYYDYPSVQKLFSAVLGECERIKMFFSCYRFNSTIFNVLSTYLGKGTDSNNGYMPLNGTVVKNMIYSQERSSFALSTLPLVLLNDLFSVCAQKGIILIGCFSPSYNNSEVESKQIGDVFNAVNVPYLDYSNDEYFMDHPEFFYDNGHMNDEGAKEYSRRISQDIKEIVGLKL